MTIKGLEEFGASIEVERGRREEERDYVNRLGRHIVKVYKVSEVVAENAVKPIWMHKSDNYEALGLEAVEVIKKAYMWYIESQSGR